MYQLLGISRRPQAAQLAFIVARFLDKVKHHASALCNDEAHLRAYAPHPDHQVVARELVSICDSIIDFDIAC